MNKIDDERLIFYLRHAKQIHEWAELAKDARELAHRLLCSLVPEVETLADEFGNGVQIQTDLDGRWPWIALVSDEWIDSEDGEAIARIQLEWSKNVELAIDQPYHGVHVRRGHSQAGAVRRAVAAAIDRHPDGHGFVRTSNPYWATIRNCGPEGEFWIDLGPYRQTLVDEIRRTWELFSPAVDEVLGNS